MLGELNGSLRHGNNIADAGTNVARGTGRGRENGTAAVILKVCLEGGHVHNIQQLKQLQDTTKWRCGSGLLGDNNDGNNAEQKYGRVAVPKDYTN